MGENVVVELGSRWVEVAESAHCVVDVVVTFSAVVIYETVIVNTLIFIVMVIVGNSQTDLSWTDTP